MPENNQSNQNNQQNTRNVPFEVTYEKTKARIVLAINQIAQESDLPSPILVTLLREITMENDLSAKTTALAYYELVTPEEYAELKRAKDAVDKAMEKQKKLDNTGDVEVS